MLSSLFDVSVSIVQDEINICWPIFEEYFGSFVRWPTLNEWQKLPLAVGAIDGTPSEIYRPQTEPQGHYFSGHRHYHCIHTQVVISNKGAICLIESGFLEHQNDAQQFMCMRQIANDISLLFPDNCFLLGNKICPNRHPVMRERELLKCNNSMVLFCQQFHFYVLHLMQ